MKEVDSVMKDKKDLLKEFVYDEISEFTYLKNCYMETLRIEAPT